jgi:hypothetical protein
MFIPFFTIIVFARIHVSASEPISVLLSQCIVYVYRFSLKSAPADTLIIIKSHSKFIVSSAVYMQQQFKLESILGFNFVSSIQLPCVVYIMLIV